MKSTALNEARLTRSIQQFARWPVEREVRHMAVFKVYCDESGKFADAKVVTFAGCMFEEDAVKDFDRRWFILLKDAGISCLKTNEAVRLKGEFRDWKASDRDDLLEALAKLAHERSICQFVFTMDTNTFKNLDHKTRMLFRDPIYAAFDGLMKAIAEGTRQRNTPDDRFHLVYDLCDEYSEKCLKLFDRIRVTHSPLRKLFPSLTFAYDQDFPALQAADMTAYCAKEEFLHGEGKCTGIVGRLLEVSGSNTATSGEVVFGSMSPLGEGAIRKMPTVRKT